MSPLLEVLAPVARSRVAALLVALHLIVAVYCLAQTPPLTEARWQDFNLSGDAAPIAGRELGASDQPRMLTVLILLDFPAAMALFLTNIFTARMFSSNLQTWSWINAGFMFVFTGLQWWLVGFALDRIATFIRSRRNGQRAIEQIVGRERR